MGQPSRGLAHLIAGSDPPRPTRPTCSLPGVIPAMPFRHRSIPLTVVLALVAAVAPSAYAQETAAPATVASAAAQSSVSLEAPRAVRAARATEPIRLDGRFDEAAWASAEVATDFVQRGPDVGQLQHGAHGGARAVRRRRHVRGGADVRFAARPHPGAPGPPRRAGDELGVVQRRLRQLSRPAHGLSLRREPRGACRRDVLPLQRRRRGRQLGRRVGGGHAVDSLGWTAEYRIPLSQLRFTPPAEGAEQTWGVQFCRYVRRRDEWSHWAPWLPHVRGLHLPLRRAARAAGAGRPAPAGAHAVQQRAAGPRAGPSPATRSTPPTRPRRPWAWT